MTQSTDDLKANSNLCKLILRKIGTPILVISMEGDIIYLNNSAQSLFDLSRDKMNNQSLFPLLERFSQKEALKNYFTKIFNREKTSLKKNQVFSLKIGDHTRFFNLDIKVIVNKDKSPGGLILILNNVTGKQEIEESYRAKARYLHIENQISIILNTTGKHNMICDIIRREFDLHTVCILLYSRKNEQLKISGTATVLPEFIVDMTEEIYIDLKTNKNAKTFFEDLDIYKKASLQEMSDLLLPEKEVDVSGSFITEFFSQMKITGTGDFLLFPLANADNRMNGLICIIKNDDQELDDEEINYLKLTSNFINLAIDKQFKEKQIHRLAYFDELTNLTNIKYMKEKIAAKIKKKINFCLFSIKIRNFSKVISSRGDKIGDKTLIHIAEKMKKVLGKYRNVIFSRTSGISFFCCISDCDEQKAKEVVNNILYIFRKPFYIGGNIIHLFASIGIYLSTGNINMETAIQNTNIALEKAREKADNIYQIKNNYVIYHKKMGQERKLLEEIRQELRENLATRRNFVIHYQPKCDIRGNIRGYEAMVRWLRKDNLVFPGVFIHRITEMGLSDHLFSIVLENVCRDFHKIGNDSKEISINIAPEQFNDPLLIAKINKIFKKFDINPTRKKIKFEIIESELVNSKNLRIIKDIHSLGLKISVDDFGSGYSNLRTINDLARANLIDEIKIDKSLIDGITEDSTLLAIILEMAHKLTIDVVAEGVETIHQYYVLRGLYTEVILQGWLFAKSMPVDEIVKLDKDAFANILQEYLSKKD